MNGSGAIVIDRPVREIVAPRLGVPRLLGWRQNGLPVYEVEGAAVTALWYGNAFISVFNKLIDIDSDAIKAILCTATYTPNQDTHDFYNDITNELTTTGGYTAGGKTLTTPVQAYTGGTNVWNFDADDLSWTAATFTCRYCAYYDSTPGTAATDPLLSYVDFGGDQTVSSGTFTVTHAAGGILSVTVS